MNNDGDQNMHTDVLTAAVPRERREQGPADDAPGSLLVYGLLGLLFGVVLVKSEVVSWFRIQEMFRFDSFHMYGIIGSAVVVAALVVAEDAGGAGRVAAGVRSRTGGSCAVEVACRCEGVGMMTEQLGQ